MERKEKVMTQILGSRDKGEIKHQATEDAYGILDLYWNLNHFPVDPFKIAEKHGAEVHFGDIPEDVEGLFRPRGCDYEYDQIWIDTDSSIVRQRFTCAHELGHMVEDSGSSRIDRRRDSLARRGTDPHEIYANAFAAALLMPEYAVKQLHGLGADPVDLASFFGVSPIAMGYRLKNLGLVS